MKIFLVIAFENVDIAGNKKTASKGGKKEKESSNSLLIISLKPDLILNERGVVGGFEVAAESDKASSSVSIVMHPEWGVLSFL